MNCVLCPNVARGINLCKECRKALMRSAKGQGKTFEELYAETGLGRIVQASHIFQARTENWIGSSDKRYQGRSSPDV